MMKMKVIIVGLALIAAPATLQVRAEETLETVEQRLTQKSKDIKSLAATIVMRQIGSTDRGRYSAESRGQYEFQRNADETLFRLDLKSDVTSGDGDDRHTQTGSMLRICDGKFDYKYMEQGGQQHAVKMKPTDVLGPDPATTLETVRMTHELRLLPDASLDGQELYALEARIKSATEDSGVTLLLFAKDTGVLRKMVNLEKDGQVTQTIEYTDVQLNPTIPPSRFVFKAPEGVEVVDLTKPKP